MPVEFILLAIGAYLLGSVPAAYLAARWYRGIDIRKHGTGKVGAANVLSAASRWLAIPVAQWLAASRCRRELVRTRMQSVEQGASPR